MYVTYMLRICMYMICIFTFIHTYTEHNSIKYLCTFKISKFYKCQYEKLNFFFYVLYPFDSMDETFHI